LWIWGDTEMTELAGRCELAKPTLTGMLSTLERQNLVARRRVPADRRRVSVGLTPAGSSVITELFPKFNSFESEVTGTLSDEQKAELAELLRQVIRITHQD
jgi:DNA-binding MarR family transcriptional regulator